MVRFTAPSSPATKEAAEELPFSADFLAPSEAAELCRALRTGLPLGFSSPACAFGSFEDEAFLFFSTRASVSASHAALAPPREAFLLLSHSAEPSSPAI